MAPRRSVYVPHETSKSLRTAGEADSSLHIEQMIDVCPTTTMRHDFFQKMKKKTGIDFNAPERHADRRPRNQTLVQWTEAARVEIALLFKITRREFKKVLRKGTDNGGISPVGYNTNARHYLKRRGDCKESRIYEICSRIQTELNVGVQLYRMKHR